MSKIEEYLALKSQLEAVSKVENFSLSQLDWPDQGGLQNQFIVNGTGASALFVTAMLQWVKESPIEIINLIREYMAKEVNEALLLAETETKEFISTLPKEQEYLLNKEYLVSLINITTTEIPAT
jgi:hypothetical protein